MFVDMSALVQEQVNIECKGRSLLNRVCISDTYLACIHFMMISRHITTNCTCMGGIKVIIIFRVSHWELQYYRATYS